MGGRRFFKAVMVQSPAGGVIDTGSLAEWSNFDWWRSSQSAYPGPGMYIPPVLVHSNNFLDRPASTQGFGWCHVQFDRFEWRVKPEFRPHSESNETVRVVWIDRSVSSCEKRNVVNA